jgi:nucleoside-diphosphate-sugar epimerase
MPRPAGVVLVTGALGQLGQEGIRSLLARGHTVYGCDCRPAHAFACPLWQADLVHPPADFRWPADVTTVLHLAGYRDTVRPTAAAAQRLLETNVQTVASALQACHAGVRHFVYVSSISVYSGRGPLPIPETQPAQPLSLYGHSKWLGECACHLFRAARPDLRLTILRLAQVYGPGSGAHLVLYQLIAQARTSRSIGLYCKPEVTRDYLYLTDAGAAIALAVERCPAGIWNVGGGTGITMGALAGAVRAATGVEAAATFGTAGGANLALDSTAFQRATGFRPAVSFPEGVRREVARLREASPGARS